MTSATRPQVKTMRQAKLESELHAARLRSTAVPDGMVRCHGCDGRGVVHRLSVYKRRTCEQCGGCGMRAAKPRGIGARARRRAKRAALNGVSS